MSSYPPPPPSGGSDEQRWQQPAPQPGTPTGGWSTPPTGWQPAPPGAPGGYPAAYPGYSPAPATAGWPLASWGQRVLATLIDSLAALPFVLIGVVVLLIGSATSAEGSGGAPSGLWIFLGVLFYVGAFAFWVWNLIFRQGRTGQSVGKSVIGIRVARESDGRPQGALLSLVRTILHSAIDGALCYLGYLWPLWDAKRQTFTDKILSTVVVDVKAGAPAA